MISLAYYFNRLCSSTYIAVSELVCSNTYSIVWSTVGQFVPLPACYSLNLAQWVTNQVLLAWPAEVSLSANPHRAAFLEPGSQRKESQVSLGQNHQRTLGIMETGHFGTVNMPKPKMPHVGSWQMLFLKPETHLFLSWGNLWFGPSHSFHQRQVTTSSGHVPKAQVFIRSDFTWKNKGARGNREHQTPMSHPSPKEWCGLE